MSSIVIDIDVDNFQGEGADIIGAENTDNLYGTNDGELMKGLAGDDSLSGSDGDDFLLGNAGDDTLGGGDGADTILGGAGGDIIYGYTGDDMIHGGAGADIIRGGEGSDTLFGGNGKDSFIFDLENLEDGSMDQIADFEIDQDQIFIQGLTDNSSVGFDPGNSSVIVNGEEVIQFEQLEPAADSANSTEDFELL